MNNFSTVNPTRWRLNLNIKKVRQVVISQLMFKYYFYSRCYFLSFNGNKLHQALQYPEPKVDINNIQDPSFKPSDEVVRRFLGQ